MICVRRKENGVLSISEVSRIRYFFTSKENKRLTQLFLFFYQEYEDIIGDSEDVLSFFEAFLLLLEDGLFHDTAFREALKEFILKHDRGC